MGNKVIDINNDGIPDYGLSSFNVSPLHKDLFLEIDYMENHEVFEGVLMNAFNKPLKMQMSVIQAMNQTV